MANLEKRKMFQLSDTLIQNYTVSRLNSAFKNLPLQVFFSTAANFSGPIAVLEDKGINHQFILPKHFHQAIVILNCKGQFLKSIPYKMKDHIIFFGFTKWEQLLIVDASGDYWLIDCFSGNIRSGNYTKQSLIPSEKGERQRYRGCIMMPQSNKLVLLRQKTLGFTDSPTSYWKPLHKLRPCIDNPIFQPVLTNVSDFLNAKNQQFIFLTKYHTLQKYNFSNQQITSLYADPEHLSKNSQNLLTASYNKSINKLCLFFIKPTLITIINIQTKDIIKMDPIIDVQYTLPTGKISNGVNQISYRKVSHSKYRSLFYSINWLSGCSGISRNSDEVQNNDIIFFSNPKLILILDGQNTTIRPINSCNYIVKGDIDCIRVYGEQAHQIYRIVPYIYKILVQLHTNTLEYTDNKLSKYQCLIIDFYKFYANYLDQEIIDFYKLSQLSNPLQQESNHQGEGEGYGDGEGEGYGEGGDKDNIKSLLQKFNKQYIEQEVLQPLIQAGRFCIDPVDQSKVFKFICFLKNYYLSQVDIAETCAQMRLMNSLRFQFLGRSLTLPEFQFLKYQYKEVFLTILLRYNMHFAADNIFGDSKSKGRIFLDWAKCKIQKNGDTLAFEEVRQKFDKIPQKEKNSKVFTEIAKYCIDRNKFSLAENFIELEQIPQRKVMVYLLILTAKKEKKIIEKILDTVQQCPRSELIFKVIKQLIEATWVENHLWVNILHGKPNVERHYIRYVKHTNQESLLKQYYIQNKRYQELGYEAIKKKLIIEENGIPQIILTSSYNAQSIEILKSKVNQFQKLIPNLASLVKTHQPNQKIQILRKAKSGEAIPTEEEILNLKNDFTLEYLGQILLKKDMVDLGIFALCQIKSSKVFTILQRKGRFRDAIQLAYNRKDRDALIEIKEHCPENLDEEVNKRLASLK